MPRCGVVLAKIGAIVMPATRIPFSGAGEHSKDEPAVLAVAGTGHWRRKPPVAQARARLAHGPYPGLPAAIAGLAPGSSLRAALALAPSLDAGAQGPGAANIPASAQALAGHWRRAGPQRAGTDACRLHGGSALDSLACLLLPSPPCRPQQSQP